MARAKLPVHKPTAGRAPNRVTTFPILPPAAPAISAWSLVYELVAAAHAGEHHLEAFKDIMGNMSQLPQMLPGEEVIVNAETLADGFAKYEARAAHIRQRSTLKSIKKELETALRKVEDCDIVLATEGVDDDQIERKRRACERVGEHLEKVDGLRKRLKADLAKFEDEGKDAADCDGEESQELGTVALN